jgi:RNA polymerase sigma factor (sigma-70 family)
MSAPPRPITPKVIGVGRLTRHGDERLARFVAQGNQDAFAVLYERYHQELYRYCHSILHDEADAQDALQAAMTAALAALHRDQRRAPVRPWLYRIAHNEAISLIRRRGVANGDGGAVESLSASAEERAGERARFAVLMADLADLPERQRSALLMRELSGLSHEEIAVALQTSVGAAKQAILGARRALVEFAEGRSMECEQVRRVVSNGDGRVLRGRLVRAHVRDCAACKAFADSIPARRAELNAIVPVLAAPAAANLLARVMAAGSGHGALTTAGASVGSTTTIGAAVGGSNGSAVVAVEAGRIAATTIAAKVAVGAAVLATTAGGVALVHDILSSPAKRHSPSAANRILDPSSKQQARAARVRSNTHSRTRGGQRSAALVRGAAQSGPGGLPVPSGPATPAGSGAGGSTGSGQLVSGAATGSGGGGATTGAPTLTPGSSTGSTTTTGSGSSSTTSGSSGATSGGSGGTNPGHNGIARGKGHEGGGLGPPASPPGRAPHSGTGSPPPTTTGSGQ